MVSSMSRTWANHKKSVIQASLWKTSENNKTFEENKKQNHCKNDLQTMIKLPMP